MPLPKFFLSPSATKLKTFDFFYNIDYIDRVQMIRPYNARSLRQWNCVYDKRSYWQNCKACEYFFFMWNMLVCSQLKQKSADPECIYVYTLRKIFFQNVAWFLVQLLFKLRLLFHSLLTDDIGQGVLELTWNWVTQFLEVWITNLRSRKLRKIVILKTNNFTASVKWFWSTGTCTKINPILIPM